jgi:hypothetical protein
VDKPVIKAVGFKIISNAKVKIMVDSSAESKRSFEDASNAATEGAKAAYEDLKRAAEQVGEQAKEMGSKMMSGAKSFLNEKVEAATATVGNRLKAAGDSIRQNSPADGPMGRVSSYTAQTLADAGQYIENEGFEGMVQQVKTMIRENPVRSLFVGIAIGFVVARATSNRR